MNTLARHIHFILACAVITAAMSLFSAGGVAQAEEAVLEEADDAVVTEGAVMDPAEQVLFDLINAARQDPLGTAEALGMKRKKLLKNLPELEEILTNGLPALVFDDRLYQSAANHTEDMLENSYYAYESIDGRSVAQRLSDAGYTAAVSGESLGLLFFGNFIEAEKAAAQIFANMFEDELDPEWSGQRNILNPNVCDLGVSLGGGLYRFEGDLSGNVYMATCDFGTPVETAALELLQMINQARANPKAAAQACGIDVEAAMAAAAEMQ